MRSSADGTIHTFASLRVTGDLLLPEDVTGILRLKPTQAYAKGETYTPGKRSGPIIGRTGVWYFSTDGIVDSSHLTDHLLFLVGILAPDTSIVGTLLPLNMVNAPAALVRFMTRIHLLKSLIQRKGVDVTMTFFWHGHRNAKPPSIPRIIAMFLRSIPVRLETDFATDEGPALVKVG